MQDQLQESKLTFNHKIAVQERNALANWMKARYWETRMMQQSRENAYLKYRLRMMERETLPVGSMRREPMPRRPVLQKPVWQAPRPVHRMNNSTSPQRDPLMSTMSSQMENRKSQDCLTLGPHALGSLSVGGEDEL
ncbi:transport and Golgi organization protein 1 homolog [Meles meles]|uniref:transport and Golgi organization protein 1 homolog n=1 Tax=Meles meles TaxID=9662 RepID=UPI001E6A06D3|nr:transport and Golgi organization protein 1 homolog [Meles meles]